MSSDYFITFLAVLGSFLAWALLRRSFRQGTNAERGVCSPPSKPTPEADLTVSLVLDRADTKQTLGFQPAGEEDQASQTMVAPLMAGCCSREHTRPAQFLDACQSRACTAREGRPQASDSDLLAHWTGTNWSQHPADMLTSSPTDGQHTLCDYLPDCGSCSYPTGPASAPFDMAMKQMWMTGPNSTGALQPRAHALHAEDIHMIFAAAASKQRRYCQDPKRTASTGSILAGNSSPMSATAPVRSVCSLPCGGMDRPSALYTSRLARLTCSGKVPYHCIQLCQPADDHYHPGQTTASSQQTQAEHITRSATDVARALSSTMGRSLLLASTQHPYDARPPYSSTLAHASAAAVHGCVQVLSTLLVYPILVSNVSDEGNHLRKSKSDPCLIKRSNSDLTPWPVRPHNAACISDDDSTSASDCLRNGSAIPSPGPMMLLSALRQGCTSFLQSQGDHSHTQLSVTLQYSCSAEKQAPGRVAPLPLDFNASASLPLLQLGAVAQVEPVWVEPACLTAGQAELLTITLRTTHHQGAAAFMPQSDTLSTAPTIDTRSSVNAAPAMDTRDGMSAVQQARCGCMRLVMVTGHGRLIIDECVKCDIIESGTTIRVQLPESALLQEEGALQADCVHLYILSCHGHQPTPMGLTQKADVLSQLQLPVHMTQAAVQPGDRFVCGTLGSSDSQHVVPQPADPSGLIASATLLLATPAVAAEVQQLVTHMLCQYAATRKDARHVHQAVQQSVAASSSWANASWSGHADGTADSGMDTSSSSSGSSGSSESADGDSSAIPAAEQQKPQLSIREATWQLHVQPFLADISFLLSTVTDVSGAAVQAMSEPAADVAGLQLQVWQQLAAKLLQFCLDQQLVGTAQLIEQLQQQAGGMRAAGPAADLSAPVLQLPCTDDSSPAVTAMQAAELLTSTSDAGMLQPGHEVDEEGDVLTGCVHAPTAALQAVAHPPDMPATQMTSNVASNSMSPVCAPIHGLPAANSCPPICSPIRTTVAGNTLQDHSAADTWREPSGDNSLLSDTPNKVTASAGAGLKVPSAAHTNTSQASDKETAATELTTTFSAVAPYSPTTPPAVLCIPPLENLPCDLTSPPPPSPAPSPHGASLSPTPYGGLYLPPPSPKRSPLLHRHEASTYGGGTAQGYATLASSTLSHPPLSPHRPVQHGFCLAPAPSPAARHLSSIDESSSTPSRWPMSPCITHAALSCSALTSASTSDLLYAAEHQGDCWPALSRYSLPSLEQPAHAVFHQAADAMQAVTAAVPGAGTLPVPPPSLSRLLPLPSSSPMSPPTCYGRNHSELCSDVCKERTAAKSNTGVEQLLMLQHGAGTEATYVAGARLLTEAAPVATFLDATSSVSLPAAVLASRSPHLNSSAHTDSSFALRQLASLGEWGGSMTSCSHADISFSLRSVTLPSSRLPRIKQEDTSKQDLFFLSDAFCDGLAPVPGPFLYDSHNDSSLSIQLPLSDHMQPQASSMPTPQLSLSNPEQQQAGSICMRRTHSHDVARAHDNNLLESPYDMMRSNGTGSVSIKPSINSNVPQWAPAGPTPAPSVHRLPSTSCAPHTISSVQTPGTQPVEEKLSHTRCLIAPSPPPSPSPTPHHLLAGSSLVSTITAHPSQMRDSTAAVIQLLPVQQWPDNQLHPPQAGGNPYHPNSHALSGPVKHD